MLTGREYAQTDAAADKRLSIAHRRDQGRRGYQLHPVARIRPSEGSGESGSLSDIQSAFRKHLARIKEATSRVCFPETGQLGIAERK